MQRRDPEIRNPKVEVRYPKNPAQGISSSVEISLMKIFSAMRENHASGGGTPFKIP